MLTLRPANARGHADHGWLNTFHSFSFADYHDPANMGFSALRVINEDVVAPGQGFGTHPHRDMEIITIVLSGQLQHKDSMGNSAVIRPGEVQHMSAGTGVQHSEFNPDPATPVHLMQIWIEPNQTGVTPRYAQKPFTAEERRDQLRLVASSDGRDGSIPIHQDARLFVSTLSPDATVSHTLDQGRKAYLHVAHGSLTLNGQPLGAGDGVRIQDESVLAIAGVDTADLLLFDLP